MQTDIALVWSIFSFMEMFARMYVRTDVQIPPVFYRTSSPSGPLPCSTERLLLTNQQQGKGSADHILPLGDWFLNARKLFPNRERRKREILSRQFLPCTSWFTLVRASHNQTEWIIEHFVTDRSVVNLHFRFSLPNFRSFLLCKCV